ncbi:MAG TPA: ATP-binding protein [Anaerolineales bacterium]
MEIVRSFIQSVYSWIRKPDFKDHDQNLSSFYIQAIAMAVVLFYSIVAIPYILIGKFSYVFLLSIVILFMIVVLVLVRSKRLSLASYLFIISLLGLETIGILYGDGIHSSIAVLYPVILMIASLILERRAFIHYVILCGISVGGIIYAEHQRIIPPYKPDPADFPLFITYLLMILGSALLIRYITESLQNGLRASRRHEQQLAAQKSMLDQVGQAVVGLNAENVIVYWNQAAADLYGCTAEEAVGRSYREVINLDLNPETLQAIRQTLEQNHAWTGELTARRRDGRAVPLIGNIAPILDAQNKTNGWVAVAADLTEREKAAQIAERRNQELSLLNQLGISLASGRDLYNTLLALQAQIIKLIQADAFFVAIYDETTNMVNFPIFLVGGKPFETPPQSLHQQPGLTGAVISGGKSLYLPDMSDPAVIETYHPLGDEYIELRTFFGIPLRVNDQIIGMMSVQSNAVDAYSPEQIQLMENVAVQAAIAIDKARLLDQLQKKLVEHQTLIHDLENKNTELERFIYTISHDLKAPLITIRGFLGFIEKDSQEGNIERLRSDIQRVTDATEKMQRLLRDLLELSRIGRLVNESTYVPFEELISEALEIVQGRISQNSVEVHVQPNLPAVFGDKPRLIEVLQNLLDNAAKFMGDQPHPMIEIGQKGEENGKPIFFVKDNGIGIASDHHERVFGLFNKLDMNSEGTGVGLAIVKRIVEVHGGRIWVESEAGRGSTFFFTLEPDPVKE